ncbi:MAG TPA: hypothetical protein VHN77_14105, partial [Phycisphaerales bacterium]|nr:hypothetical protein [Phycisphaerales bacterium]
TATERSACDPAPVLARQRRADLRSAFWWGAWGLPCFIVGIALFTQTVHGTLDYYWLVAAVPLMTLGGAFLCVCFGRLEHALFAREIATRRTAFDRGTVETWAFTIDRAWWNLADEDCDGRLMRTTDGRYVFLGTYEWLDIPMGEDDSRPMCPSRLRVVDDVVNFTLTALEGPMIPLESVSDELPREVYGLPHFEVVVYDADSLPAWLRRLVEPGVQ